MTNAVDSSNSNPVAPAETSVLPRFAGWVGLAMVVLGVGAFGGLMYYSASAGAGSLGFAAISGIIILSISLYGLILLTRAIGMADPTEALALPNGSVRALLALLLAVVFIAVASWTLGGLFDRLGPPVFDEQMKTADETQLSSQFPPDKFLIVPSPKGAGTDEVKVYPTPLGPNKDLVDIAKQIVTISATVLVTIVGFYFGSKSASDAVGSAGAALKAVHDALGETDSDSGTDATTTLKPEDVAKTGTAIATMASATASGLADASKFAQPSNKTPLEVLQTAAQGHDDLKDAMASAMTSYAAMQADSKTCSECDQQAKALGSAPDAADKMGKLYDQVSQANHDFSQAQTTFVAARDKILKVAGVG